MKSRIIRIVAFVLSAAILFAASPFMFSGDTVSGRTIKDIENEIAECKKMLEALKKELSSINTDIKQLENQSSQTEKSLQEYSARIEALETEIEINTQIMESYDFKKADVAAQIAVADANYEYQKEMYKNLIQFIYENSTVNNMELLFTSDNIAQFLSKRDNFDELVNAAEEILRSIKSSLRDLEVLEEELEANQNEYKEYTKQLEISRIELEKAVEDYEEIAASLGLDYEELRDKYKGTNSQIAELNARIKKLTKERDALYESEKGFAWPLESGVSYRISSRFGYRNDPFTGKRKFHSGLDIACARGSGIIASKSGTITTIDRNGTATSFGKYIVIYHGNGISTLYAHCDSIESGLKVGDSVKQRQLIARVGMTGRSTGYHLHFGVINTNQTNSVGTHYDNPEKYLPKGYL